MARRNSRVASAAKNIANAYGLASCAKRETLGITAKTSPLASPATPAAEPLPDERDHRRGGGHRDHRRQAHGRRGLAEHRHPQVQPEVVDAEHRVDVVQHGPQLRQGTARGRPACELVAPQLRHADLEQAELRRSPRRARPRSRWPPRTDGKAPARARTHLTWGGRLSGSRRSDPTARDLQPPTGVAVHGRHHDSVSAADQGSMCSQASPPCQLRVASQRRVSNHNSL